MDVESHSWSKCIACSSIWHSSWRHSGGVLGLMNHAQEEQMVTELVRMQQY